IADQTIRRKKGSMDLPMMLSVLSQVRQLRQRDQWTRQQVQAYQADAFRRLRAYTYAHSPFYHQFHWGLYDAPLQELPVLTKAMMMEHFDELVTDRAIHLEDVKAQMQALTGDERYLGRYWQRRLQGAAATLASSSSIVRSGSGCWPPLPVHANGEGS